MPSKLPRFLLTDPFTVPPTQEEQKALTPEQVTLALDVTGMLPQVVSDLLGDPDQQYYFQNDHGKKCLTRYTPPSTPPTQAQLDAWAHFGDAVRAWQALTLEQKEVWNTDPRRHDFRLPGYQWFLRQWLRGKI